MGCVAIFAVGSVARDRLAELRRVSDRARDSGVWRGRHLSGRDRRDRRRVPPERRGAALGLVAATWGVAAIIGPLFGGLVTHFVSWRWIFVPNVPLAAVVFWLAQRDVPATAPRATRPLDVCRAGAAMRRTARADGRIDRSARDRAAARRR